MTPLLSNLLETLRAYPATQCFWVAYSGGLDSHVLLHALAQLRSQLTLESRAIHIHHGLQPQADNWATHCQQVCGALAIPCEVIRVNVRTAPRESLEANARTARYDAIAQLLAPDDVVLTAQHADDQAETLLLQLLRGAGVAGLASMPLVSRLGQGWLVRPLLTDTRAQLHTYAQQANLRWIEDSSNADTRFDRNFLRHEIMPLLQQRWTSVSQILSRVARHQAEADELVQTLAEEDLYKVAWRNSASNCRSFENLEGFNNPEELSHNFGHKRGGVPNSAHNVSGQRRPNQNVREPVTNRFPRRENPAHNVSGQRRPNQNVREPVANRFPRRGQNNGHPHPEQLFLPALIHLNPARQRNVLRFWLKKLGLPLPSTVQLQHILSDTFTAREDRQPLVRWHGGEVRRYRHHLFAMPNLPPVPEASHPLSWILPQLLRLPLGELTVNEVQGQGIALPAGTELQVRFRQGGETFCWRKHQRVVKKLLQSAQLPPWQRPFIPLIYLENRLIAIPNIGITDGLVAQNGEKGWEIQWRC